MAAPIPPNYAPDLDQAVWDAQMRGIRGKTQFRRNATRMMQASVLPTFMRYQGQGIQALGNIGGNTFYARPGTTKPFFQQRNLVNPLDAKAAGEEPTYTRAQAYTGPVRQHEPHHFDPLDEGDDGGGATGGGLPSRFDPGKAAAHLADLQASKAKGITFVMHPQNGVLKPGSSESIDDAIARVQQHIKDHSSPPAAAASTGGAFDPQRAAAHLASLQASKAKGYTTARSVHNGVVSDHDESIDDAIASMQQRIKDNTPAPAASTGGAFDPADLWAKYARPYWDKGFDVWNGDVVPTMENLTHAARKVGELHDKVDDTNHTGLRHNPHFDHHSHEHGGDLIHHPPFMPHYTISGGALTYAQGNAVVQARKQKLQQDAAAEEAAQEAEMGQGGPGGPPGAGAGDDGNMRGFTGAISNPASVPQYATAREGSAQIERAQKQVDDTTLALAQSVRSGDKETATKSSRHLLEVIKQTSWMYPTSVIAETMEDFSTLESVLRTQLGRLGANGGGEVVREIHVNVEAALNILRTVQEMDHRGVPAYIRKAAVLKEASLKADVLADLKSLDVSRIINQAAAAPPPPGGGGGGGGGGGPDGGGSNGGAPNPFSTPNPASPGSGYRGSTEGTSPPPVARHNSFDDAPSSGSSDSPRGPPLSREELENYRGFFPGNFGIHSPDALFHSTDSSHASSRAPDDAEWRQRRLRDPPEGAIGTPARGIDRTLYPSSEESFGLGETTPFAHRRGTAAAELEGWRAPLSRGQGGTSALGIDHALYPDDDEEEDDAPLRAPPPTQEALQAARRRLEERGMLEPRVPRIASPPRNARSRLGRGTGFHPLPHQRGEAGVGTTDEFYGAGMYDGDPQADADAGKPGQQDGPPPGALPDGYEWGMGNAADDDGTHLPEQAEIIATEGPIRKWRDEDSDDDAGYARAPSPPPDAPGPPRLPPKRKREPAPPPSRYTSSVSGSHALPAAPVPFHTSAARAEHDSGAGFDDREKACDVGHDTDPEHFHLQAVCKQAAKRVRTPADAHHMCPPLPEMNGAGFDFDGHKGSKLQRKVAAALEMHALHHLSKGASLKDVLEAIQ